jgi:hypothetical protein
MKLTSTFALARAAALSAAFCVVDGGCAHYLYQDYENNGFVWKMAAYEPYLGVGIRF